MVCPLHFYDICKMSRVDSGCVYGDTDFEKPDFHEVILRENSPPPDLI